MAKKPGPDPLIRMSVTLRESLWAEVGDYMRREGAVSLADATRRLVRAGLDAEADRGSKRPEKAK